MGLSSCAEEEGVGKGEYGFSSLLKQKIKGKNLLRHLQRRNFFFINFILFYVTKCLRSKKKKKKLNGPLLTTTHAFDHGKARIGCHDEGVVTCVAFTP